MSASSRIRWKSRRGLKELDVLLERFLARRYPQLSVAEQGAYDRLLDHEDTDLQHWLIGSEQPTDRELQHIVQLILSTPAS
ncbi:succinate dehydrogenase assembly factor 2 [Alkalilimnicola sp. S0819]|uniref:FAD assembly factor SdhE n=1 Tax=Alkalilimnicola sp. S0819 TaxID=2613922 RepID=UPI001262017A|nr:succinate dehydrogenase assembly factor 2 [Alkalilimnicola sp. S0819]KAB7627549.1 succinate dehydrogenase assembly factor 2 [Alkalilimnicola sp. S0819]MPQ15705.1 succinate dehydrogenase assembly factor 2 [Alkalilimnicola sp. S0819]